MAQSGKAKYVEPILQCVVSASWLNWKALNQPQSLKFKDVKRY